MAVQLKQRMTAQEFDHWMQDAEGDYEYIAGEAVAVVSNNYSSQIALLIGAHITMFVQKNNLGWVTGADGGYMVNGERYIPDVGFISRARQAAPSHAAYNPNAPDLAVEVLSPTDKERLLLVKLSNYLAAGTTVWIVYPEEQEVHVHQPGKGAVVLGVKATLTASDGLLPGFELKLSDLFPQEAG